LNRELENATLPGNQPEICFFEFTHFKPLLRAKVVSMDQPASGKFLEYEFHDDRIWCEDFNQEVMMDWERPLMQRMAEEVCHNRGDVLEVGFGMAICAEMIQQLEPRSHTIIECHPQVLPRLHAWAAARSNVRIVEGMWQDAIQELEECRFDGITWDTFGGVDSFNNRQLYPPFFEFVKRTLKPNGRFTFFNPNPEPVAIWEDGLLGARWEDVAVDPPPNQYYNLKTICMPVWTQDEE